jgi:hypothetical protein
MTHTVTYNPDTHKLVPIEPNEHMIKAILGNIGKWPHNADGSVSVAEQFKSDWAVALQAAPDGDGTQIDVEALRREFRELLADQPQGWHRADQIIDHLHSLGIIGGK